MRAKSFVLITFFAGLTAVTALGACGKPAPVAPAKLEAIKTEPSEAVSGKIMSAKKKSEELKIKLKRDKDGEYAWEIDGSDVGAILTADRALKTRLRTAGPKAGQAGEE
ncbi:MAG: hypothetical protein WA666_01545 [Nitrospirota bacterium]